MTAGATVWMCVLSALLSCCTAQDHNRETDHYRVSAGHLFLLKCPLSNASSHVVWSRGGGGQPGLPRGVEVKDGILWFMPVHTDHNGTYACETRCESGSRRLNFLLSVSTESCPDPSEERFIRNSLSGELPCKQDEVFSLKSPRKVRWMKDCHHVQQRKQQQEDDDDGGLRLLAVSQGDTGVYTCLVDVTVEGKNYTAARSVQLTIDSGPVYVEPQVVMPQGEVVVVEVGMRAEVKCLAYIGPTEDNGVVTFWTIDGDDSDEYKEISVFSKFIPRDSKVFWHSTLSISRVPRHFLDVPITCHIYSPLAHKNGCAWLREADHSALYLSVGLSLLASGTLVLVVIVVLFFKVDLVLAYRKLLTRFQKQKAPDGKLYDAYVSFLHPDSVRSDETERFALQMLPKELEDQHGYSLYIRGRDDCPGEAMHEAISISVSLCRRLIIVLSSPGQSEDTLLLRDHQTLLCYEQKVGLYDALTQNDPRVILVETGGAVDYRRLPESLRYIKQKHGALKWNGVDLRSGKLGKLNAERNFWKNLRYRMPPAPARNFQAVV